MIDEILTRSPIPFLVSGEWMDKSDGLPPHQLSSFTTRLSGFPKDRPSWTVARPGTREVLRAASSLARGQEILSSLPRHRRREILENTAGLLERHRSLLSGLVTAEVGKPVSASLAEVDRAITTFRVAATQAPTFGFEQEPGEAVPQGTGMVGLVDRVSAGPVLAITPYNF
ncbi:MAG: aldehyde dehydrogenase family protein, partial [Nitrospiraceae bacterium]|nr:aldehyde dehydrogenase family protein [Nitrospiraceae bacterium]